jgi:hypothetical protein
MSNARATSMDPLVDNVPFVPRSARRAMAIGFLLHHPKTLSRLKSVSPICGIEEVDVSADRTPGAPT